ncbi:MAG: L,D-transpeptidase [Candidatus Glassbacteria bacterium]|nr:L,D-transpeptidase [Candidatus Glassbacteria bacterium]
MPGLRDKLHFKPVRPAIRSGMLLAALLLLARPLSAGERPFYILDMGGSQDNCALLVDKKTQLIGLYRVSADGPRLVKQYRCTTGRNNNGTKVKEGDKKTPNGIYFFRGILEDEQLPQKYGIRAFTMDYPNDYDRLNSKTGYGIWLHGVDDDSRVEISYDTEGCVVVTNEDILDLGRYIKLRDTPVIVDDSIYTFSGEDFEAGRKQVGDFTGKWAAAWRDKQIDEYMDCYDERFQGSGRNKAQHRAHKTRLNKLYKKIEVDLSDLRAYQYHDYVVVSFIQDYHSSLFRSVGRKWLYLSRTPDGFKIFSERFSRQQ